MQTSCHEAPQSDQAHFVEVAHHTSDQFLYQGAVVVAIVLFLVSLWSL